MLSWHGAQTKNYFYIFFIFLQKKLQTYPANKYNMWTTHKNLWRILIFGNTTHHHHHMLSRRNTQPKANINSNSHKLNFEFRILAVEAWKNSFNRTPNWLMLEMFLKLKSNTLHLTAQINYPLLYTFMMMMGVISFVSINQLSFSHLTSSKPCTTCLLSEMKPSQHSTLKYNFLIEFRRMRKIERLPLIKISHILDVGDRMSVCSNPTRH